MNVKIFHHNDADGRCAAFVMAHWFTHYRVYADVETFAKSCEFFEMDYKDKVPVERILPGDTVAVVDFSFPPDVMRQVRDKVGDAGKVVWCDHHVTAKEYGYDDLDGYRDFSEKGLCGAECVWEWCYPSIVRPYWLSLLGDYDSWRLKLGTDTFAFYEGLKLHDQSPDGELWERLLMESSYCNSVITAGYTALKYRDNYCGELRKAFAYETEINGVKALALNAYRFGSGQFGPEFKAYPVCIAYIHDGDKYTVSLYSETVDVSVIAKEFGGGGHKGAAGFVCTRLPFVRTGGMSLHVMRSGKTDDAADDGIGSERL